MTVLASADALPAGARLLDVRWELGGPNGRPAYLEGHLPGAVFVDLDADLSSHGPPEEGRHPLPGLRELQAAARGWGLNDGDRVVVYDGGLGPRRGPRVVDARAGAACRTCGILDGGLPAWQGGLESGEVITAPGDIVLTGGGMPTLGPDEAAALARDGVLARRPGRPAIPRRDRAVRPRPGHIPGARNAPADPEPRPRRPLPTAGGAQGPLRGAGRPRRRRGRR